MIQLKDTITPTPVTLSQLATWQSEITGTYAEQITLAKTNFKNRNHNNNATFNDVKQALTEMSSGAKRCCYCEDSAADEIVNIEPKNLFPEKTFDFGNYLYACGFCHRLKSNPFVIRLENQTLLNLVDFKKQHPNTKPPAGTPLLINPRLENGMDFLRLDLQNTFYFVAIPTMDVVRANYTQQLLRLNNREYLPEARREAYHDYKLRLDRYYFCKNRGDDATKLEQIQQNLLKKQHPSVWFEMKRYFRQGWLLNFDEELHELFIAVPETLNW